MRDRCVMLRLIFFVTCVAVVTGDSGLQSNVIDSLIPSLDPSLNEMFTSIESLLHELPDFVLDGRILQQNHGVLEQMPIWRLQLQTHVCDDPSLPLSLNTLQVALGTSSEQSPFLLNYSPEHNAFSRGFWFTFDVPISGVSLVEHLKWFALSSAAGEGCLDQIALFVNEGSQPLFVHREVVMLKEGEISLKWSGKELRNNEAWFGDERRAKEWLGTPSRIDAMALRSMVEALVGNAIYGEQLKWGDREGDHYVDVQMSSNTSLTIFLDMKTDRKWDPKTNVQFRLGIQCDEEAKTLASMIDEIDVQVKYTAGQQFVSAGFINIVRKEIQDQVTSQLQSFAESNRFQLQVPECPSFEVSDDKRGPVLKLKWSNAVERFYIFLLRLNLLLIEEA